MAKWTKDFSIDFRWKSRASTNLFMFSPSLISSALLRKFISLTHWLTSEKLSQWTHRCIARNLSNNQNLNLNWHWLGKLMKTVKRSAAFKWINRHEGNSVDRANVFSVTSVRFRSVDDDVVHPKFVTLRHTHENISETVQKAITTTIRHIYIIICMNRMNKKTLHLTLMCPRARIRPCTRYNVNSSARWVLHLFISQSNRCNVLAASLSDKEKPVFTRSFLALRFACAEIFFVCVHWCTMYDFVFNKNVNNRFFKCFI